MAGPLQLPMPLDDLGHPIYRLGPIDDVVPQAGKWTISAWAYCDDLETFCASTFCLCCTFGATVDMLETGVVRRPWFDNFCTGPCCIFCFMWQSASLGLSLVGLPSILSTFLSCIFVFTACYAAPYRTRIREKYGLPQECGGDFCFWWFCGYCAAYEEYLEVRLRLLQEKRARQSIGPPQAMMMIVPPPQLMSPFAGGALQQPQPGGGAYYAAGPPQGGYFVGGPPGFAPPPVYGPPPPGYGYGSGLRM